MRRRVVLTALATAWTGCLRSQQGQQGQQPGATTAREPATGTATATATAARPPDEPLEVKLAFDTTVEESAVNDAIEDGRELAFMCFTVSVWEENRRIAEYDVGGAENGIELESGYYDRETASDEGDGSFRWFGGPEGETVLTVGPFERGTTVRRAVVVGTPVVDDRISATVSVDGTVTDTVEFGDRGAPERYVPSLQAENV